MEENIDLNKYIIKEETTKGVAAAFIKKHLSDFLIIIVALVYILYGLVTIKESQRTIFEIVASGTISSSMGLLFKYLLTAKGISDGYGSKKYLDVVACYTKEVESISDNVDKLDAFCDYKNKERYKKALNKILLKYHLSYSKYIKGDFSPDEYKYMLKKIQGVKIYELNSDILLSAYSDADRESSILSKNVKNFISSGTIKTLIFAIISMLIFGMFDIGKGEFSYQKLIWSTLQISIYLVLGLYKYIKAYSFITMDITARIYRITQYLVEFKNTITSKPEIYKESEETNTNEQSK